MTLIINAVTHPSQLCWWQWGKILGAVLVTFFLSTGIEHPLLWALAIHCFVDFTAQSTATALGKARGDWRVIAYHAFIAGGYAGYAVGGLAGLLLSVIIHFLVDMTNKFGLDEPAGPALDQAAHLLTLTVIWWLL